MGTEYYKIGDVRRNSPAVADPFETTLAASALVLGGVLERHPRLRLLLVHGGG
ncbi:MAG: hypothetical protein IRZ26_09740, partial [Clostridia bacterium]|nr:hypothetical protein [Clostridia bacterium]